MMHQWRIAAIGLAHMHIKDLLKQVSEHPQATIAGICDEDPALLHDVARAFAIPAELQFADDQACLEQIRPDLVIICSMAAHHGAFVRKIAPYGVHILVEKPMASSLADAVSMVEAIAATGKVLAINWPLAWYPVHVTTKRLIDEGYIGDVQEIHYYDGNRGPWRNAHDASPEKTIRKSDLAWYHQDQGGGSLQDYLGYGVTLGAWFDGGRIPTDVTTVVHVPADIDVDEQSVTIVRYSQGLSTFQTRWGTFTNPWQHQPQPRCGFVVVGTRGTISSYDYQQTVCLQTAEHPDGQDLPVDIPQAPYRAPIEYVIHCLETNTPITGPLSPSLCLLGQRIIETAVLSARHQRTMPLHS